MSNERQGVKLFGVPLDQRSQIDTLDLSLGFPARARLNFEAGSSSTGWRTQVINPESGEFALPELYNFNPVESPSQNDYQEPENGPINFFMPIAPVEPPAFNVYQEHENGPISFFMPIAPFEPPAPNVYQEPESGPSNFFMPIAPVEVGQPQGSASHGPIEVVELSSDDEEEEEEGNNDGNNVMVSPRAFVQAGSSQGAQGRTSLIDSEPPQVADDHQRNQRFRVDSPPPVTITEVEASPPPPSPQRQSTYVCPICYEPYTKATTPMCGHVFCHDCITTALAVDDRCPTCREPIIYEELIRIYLAEPQ